MRKSKSLFRDLTKDSRFTIAFVILLVLVSLAILSCFSPYHPQRMYQVPRGRPPSWTHPLGTNWLGQDVFWQLTFAVRNSLLIAIVASSISRVIAILVGMGAGYRGGVIDRILMTAGDTTMGVTYFSRTHSRFHHSQRMGKVPYQLGVSSRLFLLGLGCACHSVTNSQLTGKGIYLCRSAFRYANHQIGSKTVFTPRFASDPLHPHQQHVLGYWDGNHLSLPGFRHRPHRADYWNNASNSNLPASTLSSALVVAFNSNHYRYLPLYCSLLAFGGSE